MHNSRSGQSMRYDSSRTPAAQLLRAENATALCLACHSGGTTAQGPNVRAPSDWDPPGGGFPPDLSDPGHVAHALGPLAVVPPHGDTAIVMTCVTCHDPHGNDAYRNLRPNPSGNSQRAGVTPIVQQVTVANGGNADVVYLRSNVRYVSGMSQWCLTCHNLMTPDSPDLPHSWDRTICTSGPDCRADYQTWAGAFANRVPVQNALGQPAPDPGDQVFCLSCHKAHGSPNAGAMIYAEGTMTSTCTQCHS